MNVITQAFDIYEIPQNQRALLFERITILINAHALVKSEEK